MHQTSLLLNPVTRFTGFLSTVDRYQYRLPADHLYRTGPVPAPAQPSSPSGETVLTRLSRPYPAQPSWPRPAPRPRGPANLDAPARGRSEREHAADQGPPGQRADDPVDGDPECLLEAAHGCRGLGPEDPVDREGVALAAGLVAEAEFLLEPAHRVTGAAAGQHDDQSAPRLRADDPVDVQLVRGLELFHRRLGLRPEDPVHGHVVTTVTQQVLEGRDGMPLAAPLHQWPRLDRVAHCVLLWVGPQITP